MAQDGETRVLCYCNADLRKGEEADQVLAFVHFWTRQTGQPPPHLVFDSRLTTYRNLAELTAPGVLFITLRRRSPGLLRAIAVQPRGAWRTVRLDVPQRLYRTPQVIEQRVQLRDYPGPLRHLFVKDLGHEEPTVLVTNDFRATPAALILRYARRMLIENGLADAVNFLHLDALSSAVAPNVSFDVLLTTMATSLYRRSPSSSGASSGPSRARFGGGSSRVPPTCASQSARWSCNSPGAPTTRSSSPRAPSRNAPRCPGGTAGRSDSKYPDPPTRYVSAFGGVKIEARAAPYGRDVPVNPRCRVARTNIVTWEARVTSSSAWFPDWICRAAPSTFGPLIRRQGPICLPTARVGRAKSCVMPESRLEHGSDDQESGNHPAGGSGRHLRCGGCCHLPWDLQLLNW